MVHNCDRVTATNRGAAVRDETADQLDRSSALFTVYASRLQHEGTREEPLAALWSTWTRWNLTNVQVNTRQNRVQRAPSMTPPFGTKMSTAR